MQETTQITWDPAWALDIVVSQANVGGGGLGGVQRPLQGGGVVQMQLVTTEADERVTRTMNTLLIFLLARIAKMICSNASFLKHRNIREKHSSCREDYLHTDAYKTHIKLQMNVIKNTTCTCALMKQRGILGRFSV